MLLDILYRSQSNTIDCHDQIIVLMTKIVEGRITYARLISHETYFYFLLSNFEVTHCYVHGILIREEYQSTVLLSNRFYTYILET